MLLLTGAGHPQIVEHVHPNLGRLVQPRSYGAIRQTAEAGFPWAADNDGYNGVDEAAFERMLDQLVGLPGCLFVTCPDVVGEQGLTDLLWEEWFPRIQARGLPAAYVLQEDGCEHEPRGIPWGQIDALFIGGATAEFKLGSAAAAAAAAAKKRGIWVHMGRVNSARRARYAASIGCDSFDGTGSSMWRGIWLRDYIAWAAAPTQERLLA